MPDDVELGEHTYVVDREVLEGMLDRARRGDDNDDIIGSTKGLEELDT